MWTLPEISRTLGDMPVKLIPVNLQPKMELSETLDVSDEFRESFNAWAREMFGTADLTHVKKGVVLRLMDPLDSAMAHVTGIQRYTLFVREDDWPRLLDAWTEKETARESLEKVWDKFHQYCEVTGEFTRADDIKPSRSPPFDMAWQHFRSGFSSIENKGELPVFGFNSEIYREE